MKGKDSAFILQPSSLVFGIDASRAARARRTGDPDDVGRTAARVDLAKGLDAPGLAVLEPADHALLGLGGGETVQEVGAHRDAVAGERLARRVAAFDHLPFGDA